VLGSGDELAAQVKLNDMKFPGQLDKIKSVYTAASQMKED
jgi:hypothetical protein